MCHDPPTTKDLADRARLQRESRERLLPSLPLLIECGRAKFEKSVMKRDIFEFEVDNIA